MLPNIVLIVGPLLDFAAADLAASLNTLKLPDGAAEAGFVAAHADAVEALVLARSVDADFVDRFPKLKLIASFGVGYDNLPLARCIERGIIVVNTPDVLTADVADTALALLLTAVRRFGEAERYLRAGRWAAEGIFPLTGTLAGKRVGVLGFGRIGRAVAQRAAGFDVSISYCDVAPRPDVPYSYCATATELAAAVDILVAVLPGGPATYHMVNAQVLKALGPEGIFVNVGRGTAVDQAALIAALTAGDILGAGLDVYETEPNLPASLLALERVVLLPHMASGTTHSRHGMSRLVTQNLVSYFTTGRALTPVPETPNPA
jgi:lactate dehydrogenase-like 2-hydroxyacid dehydrogenase